MAKDKGSGFNSRQGLRFFSQFFFAVPPNNLKEFSILVHILPYLIPL